MVPGNPARTSVTDTGASIEERPRGGGREAIYASVLDAVVGHRLPPGTRLPEDQLAGLFGVSRTIVRLALQKLEFEGVVVAERNRGAQVATPTVEEARQIFEARLAIETTIVRRLCARRVTADVVARRHRALEAEEAAFHRGDGKTSIKLSGDFHILLADIAGNRVLAGFLRQLVSRTSLILAVYGRNIHATCAADEHMRLLEVIRSGDAEAAEAELARHFAAIQSRISLSVVEDKPADLAAALRLA
jgi:DNA-binding GntR family transcriptional regulator